MTPERYERLRILFDKVSEYPPEERETVARQLCDGDEDLLAELLALLRSGGQSTDELDTPVARFEAGPYQPAFSPNEILLGRFRIMRFLGRGGMGEVYEADDLETGRVALKTIRPEIAENPHILARFRHEVQFARMVTGTNVCRIHELFSLSASLSRPATAFLTMEFLEGVTLSDRIEAGGAVPLDEAERIAVQICRGLQTIHEAEVIHRDLKSRNIMLAERKRGTEAVLMDFGLARESPASSAAAAAGSSATVPGAVVGTPEYMAPEQFQGGVLTPATDIYALGVVLYELVTGEPPFGGRTPLAAAVERAKPLSKVSTVRQDLPKRWDEVIERCLRYKPEERFQTADEVAEALTARPSRWILARAYLRGHRRVTVPALAAVAVLVALLVLWYRGHFGLAGGSVEARRWYTQGTAALREGTYLKATTALQMALELDKNFVLAHARLADAWNELDFSGKAKDEILEASDLESSGALPTLDKEYVEAVRHTIMRDFSAAIHDYQSILDSLPREAKADGYVDLGRAYEKAGNTSQAIANYSAAAKLDPQAPASFVRLGVLESRRKHTAEADSAFSKAERLYQGASNLEGVAEVDFQRGNNANTQLRLDEARTDLLKSLQAAKAIPSLQLEIRALTRLSATEYLSQNTDKSVQLANQAINLAQENGLDYWAVDGLVRLGNAYISSADYQQASSYFERALSLAEHSERPRLIALAKFGLASVRESQNKPAEALPLAKSALGFYRSAGFKSESVDALTLVLRAQQYSGDNQAALQSGQELLTLAKELNEPPALMRAEESVGSVLLDLERYPEALDHFQKALAASREMNRQVENQLLKCADASWRLGNYVEAQRYVAALPAASLAHPRVALSVKEITSALFLSQQRYAKARQIARLVLADKSTNDSEFFFLVMAQIETASGSPQLAREWGQKVLAQAQSDSDRPATAAANLALANAYLAGGSPAQALPLAQAAHDFFAASGQKESEYLSLLTLAKTSYALKDFANSRKFAHEGLDILSSFDHNWNPQIYTMYLSRPDVRNFRAELELLGR